MSTRSFEFVVCSDIHLHPYKDFARVLPNGYNSRLSQGLQAFKDVIDYAAQTTKLLFVCGDTIHARTIVDVSVIVGFHKLMRYAAEQGVQIIFILGNHDLYAKGNDRRTIMDIAKTVPGIQVIDRGVVRLADHPVSIFGCSYGRRLPSDEECEMLEKEAPFRILLAHGFIAGTKTSDGYMFEDGVRMPRIRHYAQVFQFQAFGHIHTFQQILPSVIVPGSLTQRMFADSGERRGFFHVTLDRSGAEWVHRRVKSAPRYWVIDDEGCKKVLDGLLINVGVNIDEDFFCFRVSAKQAQKLQKIRASRKTHFPRQWVVEEIHDDRQAKQRLELPELSTMATPYKNIISAYVGRTVRKKQLRATLQDTGVALYEAAQQKEGA